MQSKSFYKTAWMCYECGDDISPCPAFDLEDKKYCPADHTNGNKSKYVPVTICPTPEARAMKAVIRAAKEAVNNALITPALCAAFARLGKLRRKNK